MVYKYSIGETVTWKCVPCEIISRDVAHGEYIYTIRRSDNNTVLHVREHNLVKYPADPAPYTPPTSPETIPGDRDADYPVAEKDVATVFKTFAVVAVLAYVVVRIIWR